MSVSAARGEEGETWVEGVAAVVCYGQCSASGGSVSEGWQVGSGKANYFRRYVSEFQELVSIGEGEHGEIAGGAVQEDGFNNTLVQMEQEVGFD